MATLSLTRRKTQLELLAQASAGRTPVRVVLVLETAGTCDARTCLLSLEPDGMLLDWPAEGPGGIPADGATVDVFFEHDGQAYGFRTRTSGQVLWSYPRRGQVPAWKLDLPLRITSRQEREHYRVSLADVGPIEGRFTSVTTPEHSFAVHLHNLSAGGLSATAVRDEARDGQPGNLFWADFELPGDSERLEFVVRVAHSLEDAGNDTVSLGCMFCPSEDPTPHRGQLRRVERFVTQHTQARTHESGGN